MKMVRRTLLNRQFTGKLFWGRGLSLFAGGTRVCGREGVHQNRSITRNSQQIRISQEEGGRKKSDLAHVCYSVHKNSPPLPLETRTCCGSSLPHTPPKPLDTLPDFLLLFPGIHSKYTLGNNSGLLNCARSSPLWNITRASSVYFPSS